MNHNSKQFELWSGSKCIAKRYMYEINEKYHNKLKLLSLGESMLIDDITFIMRIN